MRNSPKLAGASRYSGSALARPMRPSFEAIPWRAVVLASLGGALEHYDFVVFGVFARRAAVVGDGRDRNHRSSSGTSLGDGGLRRADAVRESLDRAARGPHRCRRLRAVHLTPSAISGAIYADAPWAG
jgi:hypothetical protein